MSGRSRPYRLPPLAPVTPERIAPLVVALGSGWKACAEALPWEDVSGLLRYEVYSPAYAGTLFLCRFQLFSPARWWHAGHECGIGGVTHWRLAADDDQDFAELVGSPPVSPSEPEALARLRHWWRWYSAYKGFDYE